MAASVSGQASHPNNQEVTNVRQTKTVSTSKPPAISKQQYNILVRLVHAEAGGEPLKGQVAVAAVILNRIRSGKFPTSIAANVFKNGEFESVSNGYIWSQPTESSYHAANLALHGWDPTSGAIYFYNPAKTFSNWIWSRQIVAKIGKHFFAV
jgi:N-acetylmuramoyl-L-alanine amidase